MFLPVTACVQNGHAVVHFKFTLYAHISNYSGIYTYSPYRFVVGYSYTVSMMLLLHIFTWRNLLCQKQWRYVIVDFRNNAGRGPYLCETVFLFWQTWRRHIDPDCWLIVTCQSCVS